VADDEATDSLAAHYRVLTIGVQAALVVLPPLPLFLVFHDRYDYYPLIPGFVVSLGLVKLIGPRLRQWAAARERAWLSAQPIGFDLPSYLAYLAHPRGGETVVTVRVAFATLPDAAALTQIADTIRVAMFATATPTWDGQSLFIQSPPIETRWKGGRGPSVQSNSRLHRWVRTVIARGLVVIARTHPVARVDVA
jgi:hypothetical protein